MINPVGRALFLMLAACVGIGCSSNPPAKQLYTLHSDSSAATAEAVTLTGGLGIGPVELPDHFRGDGIASVGADQRVLKSQVHHWAGDFKKDISRTVAASLSQQLGYDDVWPYPWDTRHRPQKQISLFIEQLHGQLGQPVTMVVKWILFDDYGNEVVDISREKFSADTADDSYASYVAAINDLVNQCAKRLESAVRKQWVKGE